MPPVDAPNALVINFVTKGGNNDGQPIKDKDGNDLPPMVLTEQRKFFYHSTSCTSLNVFSLARHSL